MTFPVFNEANFDLVLAKIKADPESWDQERWHCGTAHCFFGWAQIMAGKPADDRTVCNDARMFLGVTHYETDYLISAVRTIEDFEAFKTKMNSYDCDGYDRDGYDRDGYDRDGYHYDAA